MSDLISSLKWSKQADSDPTETGVSVHSEVDLCKKADVDQKQEETFQLGK